MLNGKTIVITGAARGIGKAIAIACAQAGANVAINFLHSENEALALAQQLQTDFNIRALPVQFDVCDTKQIETACQSLLADGIDGWVNNAAINLPGLLPVQNDQMIAQQLNTNIAGPLYCCRFVLPHMLRQRRGSIVNIGSISSNLPTAGQAVYAATKGALASLTKALAQEYGRKNIRINCIEPGPINTDMLKTTLALTGDNFSERLALRRLGEPAEIAALAVFLLSDQASFITGSIYQADGGFR